MYFNCFNKYTLLLATDGRNSFKNSLSFLLKLKIVSFPRNLWDKNAHITVHSPVNHLDRLDYKMDEKNLCSP